MGHGLTIDYSLLRASARAFYLFNRKLLSSTAYCGSLLKPGRRGAERLDVTARAQRREGNGAIRCPRSGSEQPGRSAPSHRMAGDNIAAGPERPMTKPGFNPPRMRLAPPARTGSILQFGTLTPCAKYASCRPASFSGNRSRRVRSGLVSLWTDPPRQRSERSVCRYSSLSRCTGFIDATNVLATYS
jgi:hypothetical protein